MIYGRSAGFSGFFSQFYANPFSRFSLCQPQQENRYAVSNRFTSYNPESFNCSNLYPVFSGVSGFENAFTPRSSCFGYPTENWGYPQNFGCEKPYSPPQQPVYIIQQNYWDNRKYNIYAPSVTNVQTNCPPPPPPVTPPPCPPPVIPPPPPPPPITPPPPPPPPDNYLYIAGDPIVGGNFNTFDPGFTPGQPFNLINDPDNQLSINIQTHVINPQGKQGVQQSDISVNGQSVQFANDGTLYVNGAAQGNINNAGFIAPIDLGSGCTVQTENVVDDAAGDLRKRFVLNTPEYQYTAALRQPQGAGAYYDINLAENVGTAAADASAGVFPSEPGVSAVTILQGIKPTTG